jgi:transposase
VSVGVEVLFTSALGLQPPSLVEDVKLDTAKRRIDFEVGCQGELLASPQRGTARAGPAAALVAAPSWH